MPCSVRLVRNSEDRYLNYEIEELLTAALQQSPNHEIISHISEAGQTRLLCNTEFEMLYCRRMCPPLLLPCYLQDQDLWTMKALGLFYDSRAWGPHSACNTSSLEPPALATRIWAWFKARQEHERGWDKTMKLLKAPCRGAIARYELKTGVQDGT